MKHLLLFTLSPVQSFIAQARKTHDLYAGSQLLSDLIKTAINTAGGNLIFPKMGDAMPNRFLMELPQHVTDMKAHGQMVEKAVRDKWQEIALKSLGNLPKPPGFDEQINSHLEIFWVIGETGDDYAKAVKLLEKELAAIKNVRPFHQYNWQALVGEQGRKCALDGQRNALFYRNSVNEEGKVWKPAYLYDDAISVTHPLREGEAISAVSWVKRKYQPQNSKRTEFESTAEIALLSTLDKIENRFPETKTCISLLKKINAQLFYEENIRDDKTISKHLRDAEVEESSLASIKKCSKQVKDAVEELKLKMNKYYAILTFDGDDMGKWLSGENIKDPTQLRPFQEKFAECLQDFAQAAKKRLDNGSGQTIYAGGDDFLGFVNLNHLLPVLRELRQMFEAKVHVPLTSFMKENKKISFSAGICVAHYKEPLSLVLQEAKNAQKKAKELDGKDSFAISVIKGSGESHLTALPFEADAQNIERLEKLTKALIKSDFSNNFIKTLRLEFERLMDFKSQLTLKELFSAELKRLLKRSANNPDWNKDDKKRESAEMADNLLSLYQSRETENFFQMLHIADFLQRELDNPEKQKQPSLQTA